VLTQPRADALVAQLDLDPHAPICQACLSFVCFALKDGSSPAKVRGQIQSTTRDLWHEGVSEIALAAVRRACERGVPDADVALADLEAKGRNSRTARTIVRRLAEDLNRRTRTEMHLERTARGRLREAPPEWN
jgi:hypothetical protein